MNIFVGNLHEDVSVEQLRSIFVRFGQVNSVKIIMDKETGLSRGFGFVEMDYFKDGLLAVKKLNRFNLLDRFLEVTEVISGTNKNRLTINPPQRKEKSSARIIRR